MDDGASVGDLIDAMPEGGAIRFDTDASGRTFANKVTMPELAALFGNPAMEVIYGISFRPGVVRNQRTLELEYYEPGTPENDLLTAILWKWDGVVWCVTAVPAGPGVAAMIEQVAARCGLAAKRGVRPMMPGGRLTDAAMPATDIRSFSVGMVQPDLPLDRAWLLENVPGHLVYTDPRAANAAEKEAMDRLEQDYLDRRGPAQSR